MTTERRLRRSPLAFRLTLAFVLVAVAAVVTLSGLTLWRTKHTVSRLADERQQATADSVAQTLALAFRQQGGWDRVDIHPALMIALQANADVTVLAPDGRELALQNSMPPVAPTALAEDLETHVVQADVVVDDATVGVVRVRFAGTELASAERHVRDALRGTVLLGAVAAAVLAALVAVPLGRRIIRPLQRVTSAAHLVGEGDPTARVGNHDAAGELGELARAFDLMVERLEGNEKARRDLVTDLAHEIRTPLTIVQGNCEEVIDGLAEPSLERFVHMHDDLLRLRRLVDDLNALAAADAARADRRPRHESCDLDAVAADVAGDLRALLDANQHRLTLDLHPAPTSGDPMQLRQVVTNLLMNAIKFTPPGGKLEIRTWRSPDGRTVHLSVGDSGPGIAAADRPHVFERFYRAASTRTVAGTGVGLAVVDQLVRAHGGSVSISDGDRGATIQVDLPAR